MAMSGVVSSIYSNPVRMSSVSWLSRTLEKALARSVGS